MPSVPSLTSPASSLTSSSIRPAPSFRYIPQYYSPPPSHPQKLSPSRPGKSSTVSGPDVYKEAVVDGGALLGEGGPAVAGLGPLDLAFLADGAAHGGGDLSPEGF